MNRISTRFVLAALAGTVVLTPSLGLATPIFMQKNTAPDPIASQIKASGDSFTDSSGQPTQWRHKDNQNNIVTHVDGYTPVREVSGETYLRNGVYNRAEQAFKNQPQTPEVRLKRAQAQAGAGQLTKALQTLSPIMDMPAAAQFHGDLLLHLSETALIHGRKTKAAEYLADFTSRYNQNHPSQARADRLSEMLGQIKRVPKKVSRGWFTDETITPSTDAESKQFFRVGVLLPLSGNMAPVGRDILRGLQLSLFDGADADAGSMTILYPQDTGGTPQGAAAAANRALKLGVDMMIGPLAANNVEAAASVTRRKRVPMLAFSSTAAVAAPNVHLLGYVPQQQARAAARAAVAAGKTQVAALVPSTDFGYEVLSAFTDELNKFGVSLMASGFYNPQNADVGNALNDLLNLRKSKIAIDAERRRLTRLRDDLGGAMDAKDVKRLNYLQKAKATAQVEFDALFLPATATGLNLITAQMATYDADKANFLLLGTAAWNVAALEQTPPEYVKKGLFFAPAETSDFEDVFTAAYGTPPHPLAVLGYDAARMAQSVATEVHHGGFKAAEALLRPEGFTGKGGALKLLPSGQTQRAYAAWAVSKNGVALQERPPALLSPLFLQPEARRIPTPQLGGGRFVPFE